ncbi:FAD-binding oxidoreductase [Sulfobacillus harzensis]|uniref:FAD-binding oxidoreductase n=1 Tax=Sulfobacillus harzensis TaxID=2729629 RepID=A0A7Y0L6D3_9FIRM|nr:FAD-binding oxidoreductase [Sulfobacillus harzensis]NMP23863.1 FAD-binding oxidoreductase [Sulfobacillus harzensis]
MSAAWEQGIVDAFLAAAETQEKIRIRARGRRMLEASTPVRILDLVPDENALLDVHPEDLVVTADARLTIGQLNEVLAKHGQWVPFVAADGHDDSVGGAVSAGLDTIYRGYGAFHERVLGLTVLTPGFGAIEVGAKVVKNVAGYNLPRLFVGTRGQLGIIAQVTLKVSPLPAAQRQWVSEGTLEEMTLFAESGLHEAHPWASIRLIRLQDGKPVRATLEWHGIKQTVVHLESRIGPSQTVEFLPVTPPDGASALVALAGGVPRRMMLDLFSRWQGGPLALEWQSGSFFGHLPSERAWEMMIWVREQRGGIRLLSGPSWEAPRPPALIDAWRRLKAAYDPHGVLG